MMEHVMMFDWCTSANERYFVDEADLDNCTTEKILRNKFVDPLLSSDSEDDDRPNKINWDQIFKNKPIQHSKLFVPCLRPVPPYTKLSELTPRQHVQFLKVLSDKNPHVLEDLCIGKPTRQDFKDFETAKELYAKEQKAYMEWAKLLWTTDHCIRALRPKPTIEMVYEAEFEMKAQRMRAFPKYYDVAAQITLDNQKSNCDAVLKQDLVRVTLAEMPQVNIPEKIEKQFSIIQPCVVPEPCQKHPYQIVLPNEDALSILPITEIHRELATFAANNGTQYIASENALKCLTQWNRHWLLPLSVCETIGPDGNRVNVIVLDSEFSVHKEVAPMRTYKAFRHLLEHALIPSSEKERIWEIRKTRAKKKGTVPLAPSRFDVSAKPIVQDVDMTSDDEDNRLLIIDTGEDVEMTTVENTSGFGSPRAGFTSPNEGFESPNAGIGSPNANFSSPRAGFSSPRAGFSSPRAGFSSPRAGFESPKSGFSSPKGILYSPKSPGFSSPKPPGFSSPKAGLDSPNPLQSKKENLRRSDRISLQEGAGYVTRSARKKMSEEREIQADTPVAKHDIGVYSCTCKDTLYERPPRRSFRKWHFRNKSSNEKHDIIIHSPHKAKDKSGELILEPLPEYQIDLGASEQTPDALRSVALSLALRKNASVLNVRVDGPTGDVVTFERISSTDFAQRHPDVTRHVPGAVLAALCQLQGLLPGHYLMRHEPSHGANAILLSSRAPPSSHSLRLEFSRTAQEADEAALARIPPTISTTLLPYHKLRRVLPCAFTPYENQVAKETKKPQPKKKAPPQAIKFPKRKSKKKHW